LITFRELEGKGELCPDFYATEYKFDFDPRAWYDYYMGVFPPLIGCGLIKSFRDLMMPLDKMDHFEEFRKRFVCVGKEGKEKV
jgi:hypothetical protein